MQRHRHTLTSQRPTGGSAPGPRLFPAFQVLVCGLLVTLAVTPAAMAQVIPDTGTLLIADGFEFYSHGQGQAWRPYEAVDGDVWWQWNQDSISSWTSWFFIYTIEPDYADNDPYDMWGEQHLCNLYGTPTNSSLLIRRESIGPDNNAGQDIASNPFWRDYVAADWTNIRIEFDVAIEQLLVPGVAWNLSSIVDTNYPPAGRVPEDGYILYFINQNSNGFPNSSNCTNSPDSYLPEWHLARMQGWDRKGNISGQQDWVELAKGVIVPKEPATGNPATVSTNSLSCFKTGRAFRIRLDWYCGNLRVMYMMPWGATPGVDTEWYGCSSPAEPDGICTTANKDDCWCLMEQFPISQFDSAPIMDPGELGLYMSGLWTFLSPSFDYKWDNFEVYNLGECGMVCGPWTGWAPARTDTVPFKLLYEGALLDFSAGRHVSPSQDLGKIDINTEAPGSVSSYNHSLDSNPYCNGWDLLEDLPPPSATGTANLDNILAFLEPMSTAIDYESAGSSFDWVPNFDNDRLLGDGVTPNPDYNPVPIVADGSTPINSSLLEAYDWYVAQRSAGGPWENDQYEDCRQWYVILITDGEEACEFSGGVPNPDAVCEPGQAASKFASPDVVGIDPLPVYTIGFSETVAEDSPLRCIAEETGGLFLTAENASQLSDALYEVFYRLEGEQRTFSPFKIAPPPSSTGGNPTRDYLAVFPFFQPQQGQTLWSGNLLAFPLNASQPTLPTVGDCQIDTSQMAWNAYDALAAQLAAHTEGNPQRFVYMGSNSGGPWTRHDLATIPTDATLRSEFKTLLDVSGGVTDVVAQQVVNFVRDIRVDSDADPSNLGPPADARPSGYPVLGDFFHSQPVVVNPPNTYRYVYDYGFGNHNYPDFAARQSKRRRVVVAGANDGMLHVFDGGFWNRDRYNEGNLATDPYDQIHDLGNGTELFAWVPQAVMDRLYNMTTGGALEHVEQQYMVDGPITKGDAFIDADGDGDREWRTVVLASMRRGGRGILALDITQPDPIGAAPDFVPEVSTFAGCRDGTTYGCDGEYPKVLWEFKDTADLNGNGEWDLGWTWSEPAIARIAVYNSSNPQQPNDVFVAFFGGGWDEDEADATGTYFYGVDVATGAVLLKTNMSVDLPGGVTVLDSDEDGFHDRIYFADSNGSVWRLQFPGPTVSGSTGAAGGTMTRIFDFRSTFADGGVADRQEFFTRPVPVPLLFDGEKYTWAVALGSGDRANLDREDSGIDHFYLLVDAGDTTTRGKSNLLEVDYTELVNIGTLDEGTTLDDAVSCTSDALLPPYYGWYLNLRDTEKVMFDATILGGLVYFPTFDPSTDTATSPPNVCPGAESPEPPVELSISCRASGIGRAYKLKLACGVGGYTEFNDIATSQQVVDIDGNPEVWTSGTGGGDTGPPVLGIEGGDLEPTHIVTNWRQE